MFLLTSSFDYHPLVFHPSTFISSPHTNKTVYRTDVKWVSGFETSRTSYIQSEYFILGCLEWESQREEGKEGNRATRAGRVLECMYENLITLELVMFVKEWSNSRNWTCKVICLTISMVWGGKPLALRLAYFSFYLVLIVHLPSSAF
jgi:hypothetical protein